MLKGFPSIPQIHGFDCIMYVVYCIPVGYRNVRNSLLGIFKFFPVDCLDCLFIINIQLKLKIVNLQLSSLYCFLRTFYKYTLLV